MARQADQRVGRDFLSESKPVPARVEILAGELLALGERHRVHEVVEPAEFLTQLAKERLDRTLVSDIAFTAPRIP